MCDNSDYIEWAKNNGWQTTIFRNKMEFILPPRITTLVSFVSSFFFSSHLAPRRTTPAVFSISLASEQRKNGINSFRWANAKNTTRQMHGADRMEREKGGWSEATYRMYVVRDSMRETISFLSRCSTILRNGERCDVCALNETEQKKMFLVRVSRQTNGNFKIKLYKNYPECRMICWRKVGTLQEYFAF